MRLLPILLFLLTLSWSNAAYVNPPKWEDFSMVVPAVEKEGHAWKIPIDAASSSKSHLGIAVAVHNNEILFGQYNEKEKSAQFYSSRGGRTFTKDQFFLLQEDFMEFKRVYMTELDKGYVKGDGSAGTVNGCTTVLFQVNGVSFMPVLDKPGDRSKPETVKKVGTYFLQMDTMTYWDSDNQNRFVQPRMKSFVQQANKADRVEFLCRLNFSG